MKKLVIILFCLLFNHLKAQEKKIVYVDENSNIINFIKYKKKLDSKLFNLSIVSTNTTTYKKLKYNHYFGKLPKRIKTQLSKFYKKRFGLDSSKVWFIHYIDTIQKIDSISKVNNLEHIHIDSKNRNSYSKLISVSPKKIVNNISFNKINKSLKKGDYKYIFIHFYSHNNGTDEKILKRNKYFKDHKNVFQFVFKNKINNSSSVVIFSNGEFYIGNQFPINEYGIQHKLLKLTKKPYYDKQKRKWLKKMVNL